MKFNANKFELLRYGKELDMEKNNDDKEQVWDLAIMMGNTDTFTLHIKNIVKKARDKMGRRLRVFQSRKRSLVLTLLKSLVIPLLEYCCQLWNPWKVKDTQAIEAIQRTFNSDGVPDSAMEQS